MTRTNRKIPPTVKEEEKELYRHEKKNTSLHVPDHKTGKNLYGHESHTELGKRRLKKEKHKVDRNLGKRVIEDQQKDL